MKSRYSTVYFPFSPGIPWTVKNNKYVIPKVDFDVWKEFVDKREIVVVAYGGFFESFFSLSFIEMVKDLLPGKKVSWLGNLEYEFLLKAQNLVRRSLLPLTKEKLAKYPVPLFADAGNNAYYNCLHNYIYSKSFFLKHRKENRDPLLKQIFNNALVPFDPKYTPKLRNLNYLSSEYNDWKRAARFSDKGKFILIIPGEEPGSLGWRDRDIRELAGLISRFGLSVVVCLERSGVFYGPKLFQAPVTLPIKTNLLKKAWMILSDSFDDLLVGMMVSNATIGASNQGDELYRNAEFIGAENVIFTDNGQISPMDVYAMCEGSL
jgi:hypothetical protein